ncbi:MAG: Cof-type HAD-IIB family hydrolase [Lachnospiraceae bacterium]|nr:Cof-type HAD-IIB family hydrolase [Lachnospiraceae bacterium]
MQYKLLLFDLDGTLLRNDKTISDKTLSEIMRCRRQGMLIGVSTSRSKKNSTAFTDKLCPNVLICSDGAYVICDDEPVCIAEFSNDEVMRLIRDARKVCGADVGITVDTLDEHYWNQIVNEKNWGGSIYTDFSDFKEPSLKICVEILSDEHAAALKELYPEYDFIRFSDGNWYKFTKKDATKENAILKLCEYCGIKADEIMAFGDDYADMGMLSLCGKGVAMGNAIDEVKEVADVVIGCNEEDGIAEFLSSYFVEDIDGALRNK